jgi:uncharacterized membrane protein
MEQFKEIIGTASYAIESVGVLIIIIGSIVATVKIIRRYFSSAKEALYQKYRRDIARSIILGLEFLIAGDIIRTIIVSDTLSNVGVLALIIIMRTFLAFTLHLEIEGRWPWQEASIESKEGKTA